MVVKVFGQDALDDPEPMGLKRMSKEEWPDQWPGMCDGSAAALPSDDTEELRLVRAVLKQTQLEYMPLGIAYDAETHGWRASSFHTQCDGQAPPCSSRRRGAASCSAGTTRRGGSDTASGLMP